MSSHTKRIGDIGEYSIISKLIRLDNVFVSKPIGDNCSYDIIIDVNLKLYRCQIKTCEFIKDNAMRFYINVTNPFKKTKRSYTSDETDLFLLYCIENDFSGLLTFDDYTTNETIIRTSLPCTYYYNNIRLASEFDMIKRILFLRDNGIFDTPFLYTADKESSAVSNIDVSIETSRWKIIQNCDIDFSKYGWVSKLAKLFGITPQATSRYIREHFPDFYRLRYKWRGE